MLVMRYYGGLPDVDIAAALGCRAVTVRGYATRGLAALRIEMAPQDESMTRSPREH